MKSLKTAFFASMALSLPAQLAVAAVECKNAYEKIVPFDLPLAAGGATVDIHNEVRLAYDCASASAQTDASARASIWKLDLDLLQANAKASASSDEPVRAEATVMVMGYEVAREDLDLSQTLNLNISPEPELDLSQTTNIFVGPIAIPVKYGVTAEAGLRIKGGQRGFGAALNLLPTASAKVYVQTGLDVSSAEVIARGDVNLIDEVLDSRIALYFEDADKTAIRFDAKGQSNLKALKGQVALRARVGEGVNQKQYDKELLSWEGVSRVDQVVNFSDRIILGE